MCSSIVPQNRTGQLCGKCIEGYAPAAYSYGIQCTDCTNYRYNWIKYVLMAYIPITVLFVVVTIFKLSATTPYMNAYIFFCQMISSSIYMTLLNGYAAGQSDNTDFKILTFLYGIWNLDFFRMSFKPLCLHPNISTIQVISLDYMIACYPLLLIFLTYLLVKVHDHSIVFQNLWKPVAQLLAWINKQSVVTDISLIKVFSTFFLLSYVKVVNTSLDLLMPVQVVNMSDHVLGTYTYYNGSLEYFGPEHRPYAILALLMFVLFNLMPLLLLCLYPCRCFQSCLNCYQLNSQVLRTFMDAFQGCYKFEPYDCRYFSGFFLVLRILGLLSFYFTKSWYFFIVNGIMAIPVTAFLAIVRPYKKDLFNVIDIIFLLVFILFCLGAVSIAPCSPRWSYELFAYSVLILSLVFAPIYAFIVTVYMIVPKSVITYLKKCFNSAIDTSLHNVVSG